MTMAFHFVIFVTFLFGVLMSSSFNPAVASDASETYFIDRIFKKYGQNQSSPSSMTFAKFDTLYKIFLSLNNKTKYTAVQDKGGSAPVIEVKEEENHDSHDHHDHHGHHKKRKRAVDISGGNSYKDHEMNESLPKSLCFDADDLFEIFGLDINKTIDESAFEELCPAFIQQAEGGHCSSTHTTTFRSNSNGGLISFLALTVINLVSGTSVLFFPRQKAKWYSYAHIFVLSMGISMLVCDALLHLFPHAMGLHAGHFEGEDHVQNSHNSHNGESSEPSFNADSYLWKSITSLIGLYIFIIIEMVLVVLGNRVPDSQSDERLQKGTVTSHIGMNPSRISGINLSRISGINLSRISGMNLSRISMNQSHSNTKKRKTSTSSKRGTLTIGLNKISSLPDSKNAEKDKKPDDVIKGDHDEVMGFDNKVRGVPLNSNLFGSLCRKGNYEDNPLVTVEAAEKNRSFMNFSSLNRVVWTVQIGDMVHNLIDGIVLGVSFADSFSLHGGISTAIAILMHELPHEMSVFAFSLSVGLSVRQAKFLNFLSSLFAYIGLILGGTLHLYWANSTRWAFGVSSGVFIYIGLIFMLPELMSNLILKTNPIKGILLNVAGLLVGAVIMMLLSGIENVAGEVK